MQNRHIDRKGKTLAWALVAFGGAWLAVAILLSDTLPPALAWPAAVIYAAGIAAAFRVSAAFGWLALIAGVVLIAGPTIFDPGMLGFVLLGGGTIAGTFAFQRHFSSRDRGNSASELPAEDYKVGGKGW